MQARGGQAQWREQLVKLCQRASADQRHGATEAFADAGYPVAHLWWQADIFGLCREPDQRAVHVKEQGTSGIQRGGRADGRFDHSPTMPRGT